MWTFYLFSRCECQLTKGSKMTLWIPLELDSSNSSDSNGATLIYFWNQTEDPEE